MLELTLKRDELLKGLSQTQSIAEKRSSMPILSNVLLEVADNRLAITATDLEITFRGTYEADIKSEGRLTVPAKKLYEIVRVLGDDEVRLEETEGYNLVLTGERSKYQLKGLTPEDFPPMPSFVDVAFIDIETEQFADMVDKTIYSIAMEETRYNLSGIFIEKAEIEEKSVMRMVSTDGHRLSLIEREIPGLTELGLPQGVIISKKGMNEIRKLAEENEQVKLGFTSNSAVVQGENVIIIMRMLQGKFPDYNLVIPKKNDKHMSLGRKSFLDMLRRVSVMSSDEYKGVKYTLEPKELTLTAVNPELGEANESLPVDYDGESVEIGFNPRYFIEALSSLNSDVITISFLDSGNPCRLSAEGDPGYVGVIMPMKI